MLVEHAELVRRDLRNIALLVYQILVSFFGESGSTSSFFSALHWFQLLNLFDSASSPEASDTPGLRLVVLKREKEFQRVQHSDPVLGQLLPFLNPPVVFLLLRSICPAQTTGKMFRALLSG